MVVSFLSLLEIAKADSTDSASGDQEILCLKGESLNVLSDDLGEILFSGERYDAVNRVQDWEQEEISVTVNGATERYVKVSFPEATEEDAGNNSGYVLARAIKKAKDCEGYQEYIAQEKAEVEKRDQDVSSTARDAITGLNDPDCCFFPVYSRPMASYTAGAPMFGSRRSHGTRIHAGVDLYQHDRAGVRAVAQGRILRFYEFYESTWAVEVVHPGGFVVRYGEIQPSLAAGLRVGGTVDAGARLGSIKKINIRNRRGQITCCHPMLHFELYAGTRTGPLTDRTANRYQRRADLMNPTPYIRRWEARGI